MTERKTRRIDSALTRSHAEGLTISTSVDGHHLRFSVLTEAGRDIADATAMDMQASVPRALAHGGTWRKAVARCPDGANRAVTPVFDGLSIA
jgi:hypothetical protein